MNTSSLKNQILENVRQITDESHLQMLHDLSAVYANKDPMDIIDFFPPKQLERLEKSIRQAKIGNTHSHEGARQISRQWLGE